MKHVQLCTLNCHQSSELFQALILPLWLKLELVLNCSGLALMSAPSNKSYHCFTEYQCSFTACNEIINQQWNELILTSDMWLVACLDFHSSVDWWHWQPPILQPWLDSFNAAQCTALATLIPTWLTLFFETASLDPALVPTRLWSLCLFIIYIQNMYSCSKVDKILCILCEQFLGTFKIFV